MNNNTDSINSDNNIGFEDTKNFKGLEPIIDHESVANSKITIHVCPRCGNQINHHNSKYRCKFCKQQLVWKHK